MKYTTFRALLVSGGVIAGTGALIGACFLCSRGEPGEPDRPAPLPVAVGTGNAPATGATATAAAPGPVGEGSLRPMDTAVLQRIAQNISGATVKDAFPGQPYKVNLFKDAGQAGVNRVKIDLDRDDKWDEKWDIVEEGGKQEIKRQVAPADDESYTDKYRLREGAWVKK